MSKAGGSKSVVAPPALYNTPLFIAAAHSFTRHGTGQSLLEAKLRAIDAAPSSVCMETFTFGNSKIGRRFRSVPAAAAERACGLSWMRSDRWGWDATISTNWWRPAGQCAGSMNCAWRRSRSGTTARFFAGWIPNWQRSSCRRGTSAPAARSGAGRACRCAVWSRCWSDPSPRPDLFPRSGTGSSAQSRR